jgi:multidrug efflux pump subunit AcrA (membrane-fusion protein)
LVKGGCAARANALVVAAGTRRAAPGEVARRHRRPVRIQILILIRVDVGAVVAEADAQRQRSAVVDGATLVPASAILADDEGATVVKVVDDKNIAHDRPVQVGAREPEMVQVTGVEPGERVIKEGVGPRTKRRCGS